MVLLCTVLYLMETYLFVLLIFTFARLRRAISCDANVGGGCLSSLSNPRHTA